MARSVVLNGTTRCPKCQMAPRWCICTGLRTLTLPVAVEVLMHRGEQWRPTSTGNLITRVVPDARRHIYDYKSLPSREDVCGPVGAYETWVLHPRGDILGEEDKTRLIAASSGTPPLKIILIDGTWSQANDMLRHTDGWGRKVSLPPDIAKGETSRFWLRTQHRPEHFSTIEALIFLLGALGCPDQVAALQLQFELHVYACLLARGNKAGAEKFLPTSPVRDAFPEIVEKLKGKPERI